MVFVGILFKRKKKKNNQNSTNNCLLFRNMLKMFFNQLYQTNKVQILACVSACMVLARRKIINDYEIDEDELFFAFPLKWLVRFRVAYCTILQRDLQYVKRCSLEKTLPTNANTSVNVVAIKSKKIIAEYEDCVVCRKTFRTNRLYCVCRKCNHTCHLEVCEGKQTNKQRNKFN